VLLQRAFRSRRGTVLLESVMAFMVLTLLFFGLIEMFGLIRDGLAINRIARAAAREAAVTGNVAAGRALAADMADQYFGPRAGSVRVEFERYDGYRRHSVTCRATYPHMVLNVFRNVMGRGEVNLSARAVFGWYDFSQQYE